MGHGQYGPLESFLNKNSGVGMENGMLLVSDGLRIVGAIGNIRRRFAQVASGSTS